MQGKVACWKEEREKAERGGYEGRGEEMREKGGGEEMRGEEGGKREDGGGSKGKERERTSEIGVYYETCHPFHHEIENLKSILHKIELNHIPSRLNYTGFMFPTLYINRKPTGHPTLF